MTRLKGTVRFGQHTWPATAMGAAEFRRTQGKKGEWLNDIAQVWMSWCKQTEPGMRSTPRAQRESPKSLSTAATRCWQASETPWNTGTSVKEPG